MFQSSEPVMTDERHLCIEKGVSSFKFNKKANNKKVRRAGKPKPHTAPVLLGSSIHVLIFVLFKGKKS